MDENWESTTKRSHFMREALIMPTPGLGMLALALLALGVGDLMFLAGVGIGHPLPILLGIACGIFTLIGLIGPDAFRALGPGTFRCSTARPCWPCSG